MVINTPSQDRCVDSGSGSVSIRVMEREEVTRAHVLVMCGRVMFSKVICQIVSPAAPVHEKLALFDAIADPVKAHVHGFRTSLFDGAVGDSGGAGIVGLDWSGWLWMAHVLKRGSKHGGFFAIEE